VPADGEADATGVPALPQARPSVPRWAAPTFAVLAIVLVPWIGVLAVTLPPVQQSYARVPWVGFDIALMMMLATTAVLAWRGTPRVAGAAIATATLLVVDAWFDVTTSLPSVDRIEAAAMAVVELALAGVCLWLARHAELVLRTNIGDLLRWRHRRRADRMSAG
jgi:hypothetical protein